MSDFEDKLGSWLRDPVILQRARSLIADDTLSDTRIANWQRTDRERPKVFTAGAALGYSSITASGSGENPANLVAKEFWQLFTVEPPKDGRRCNGVAYRYWNDVQPIRTGGEAVYFSHQTYYSVPDGQQDVAYDLFTEKPVERQYPHEQKDSREGRVTVSWEVNGSSPQDFGYRVPAEGVIAADNSGGEQFDYVGGVPSIPVERAITIVQLPRDILAQSKPPRLHSMQFLQGVTSFKMIELFLSERLHRRYLGPWFKELDEVEPRSRANIKLPKPLEQHLGSSEDSYIYFQLEIQHPAPYLTYLAAFELKKAGMFD